MRQHETCVHSLQNVKDKQNVLETPSLRPTEQTIHRDSLAFISTVFSSTYSQIFRRTTTRNSLSYSSHVCRLFGLIPPAAGLWFLDRAHSDVPYAPPQQGLCALPRQQVCLFAVTLPLLFFLLPAEMFNYVFSQVFPPFHVFTGRRRSLLRRLNVAGKVILQRRGGSLWTRLSF